MFRKNYLLAKPPANPFADADPDSSMMMAKYYAEYRPEAIYTDVIRKIMAEKYGPVIQNADAKKKYFKQGLDVGCGPGLSAFVWNDYVEKMFGIDSSASMLACARNTNEKKFKNKIVFNQCHVEDMDRLFKPKQFDLVTMANSFRLVDPQRCLNQVSRVLDDFGTFVIYYYFLHGIDGPEQKKFATWLKTQFFEKYPLVSRGRKFSPDPAEPVQDFIFSSQFTYHIAVPMNLAGLKGLLMSTSGFIDAIKKGDSILTVSESQLLVDLQSFFRQQSTISVVFEVSALRWVRSPRLSLGKEMGSAEESLRCRL